MQETTLSKDDIRITKITVKEECYSDRYGFSTDTDSGKAFFTLCSAVRQCGEAARANQSLIHRSLKDDGSILTETDLAVSDAIVSVIRKTYQDCNIITEEIDLKGFDKDARYTFILDPIDGTDAYSQGLPAWAVALGVLDRNRKPCGAIIYAPRFGVGTEDLFICSRPDEDAVYLNGKPNTAPEHYSEPRQMVIASNIMNYVDMHQYRGKVRAFGSSIVHMIAPTVISNLDCTINGYCYAWDIASANAIVVKSGLEMCYIDGSEIEYDDALLIERKQIRLPLLAGNRDCVNWMREHLKMY